MAIEGLSRKRRGIFPGWWTLVAGGIMCAWAYGVFSYSFGAYFVALAKEFGWTRAQLSLGYSLHRLEGGLEGPFGGLAIDKWGPRAVSIIGFIMLGTGLILMRYVNALWMYYLIWVMAATGANLGLADALDAAMAKWFVKRRGTMIAIMRSTIAFGSPVIIPMVVWLLATLGWRDAFTIVGIGTILIGVPLNWFFIKPRRPEYYGWLPDGRRVEEGVEADTEAVIQKGIEYAAEMGEAEFTVKQALRDRIWWICVFVLALRGMVAPAVTVHTIPLLTDRGMDPVLAGAAMGTYVFMTAPGRLLFGWLGDIVNIRYLKYLVILAILIEAVGLFILTRATTMTWLWVYLVVYGLGHGAGISIWPPLRGRYWGRKAYATIQGSMMPFTMIAGIIAPVYAGWTYDTTGSYTGAFNVLAIFLLVAAVIMYFANPPKRPEQLTHITDIV